MRGPIEGLIKSSSLGISDFSEEDKDGYLLVLKDNSEDVDKLWSTVGYLCSIFDGIRVYNSYGNSEEILDEFPYGVIFGAIESIIFGLSEYSKSVEELCCKKSVWLVESEWTIGGIIEGNIIGCVEGFI